VNLVGAGAVLLVGASFFVLGGGLPSSSDDGEAGSRDPVAVTSDTRHRFTTLAGLAASSDLAIAGRVVAVERGRTFGAVDDAGRASDRAVQSQVVAIEVEDGVAQDDAPATPESGTVVLVEEEAALVDGTPIIVDGARPARVGDAGIWFLAASTDPEFPGFTTVNSQGRYLLTGDRTPDAPLRGALHGADRSDALVRDLEALGFAGLADATADAMTER
jgi:hypothetical protein